MPTNRKKRVRHRRGLPTDPAVYAFMAEQPIPEGINKYLLIDFEYPTVRQEKCQAEWDKCKELILEEWTKPGTRPQYWWIFDAPKANLKTYTGKVLTAARKRLGGIGTPVYEVLNITPSFRYGVPTCWVDEFQEEYYNGRARDVNDDLIETNYKEGDFSGVAIDPDDPPVFESQAAYLKRHKLLSVEEKKDLTKSDYEPEIIKEKLCPR
ncbi:MAG: hypothetical protein BMS9Abin36_0796 [Gammaproteobacteria bacterium]|nr:MAG: hypothetical protein BMS9Abin36_0796 [Gammaproteobacteria bacterium]